ARLVNPDTILELVPAGGASRTGQFNRGAAPLRLPSNSVRDQVARAIPNRPNATARSAALAQIDNGERALIVYAKRIHPCPPISPRLAATSAAHLICKAISSSCCIRACSDAASATTGVFDGISLPASTLEARSRMQSTIFCLLISRAATACSAA